MIYDNFVGFLRTADVMLAHAANAAKEDWEEGEVMMNPLRVKEAERLLSQIRASTKAVALVSAQFNKIAEMRAPSNPTKSHLV